MSESSRRYFADEVAPVLFNPHHDGKTGRFTSKGGGGGAAGAGSERAARAKTNYKPSTRAKQRVAAASEKKIARMVGGKDLDDNEPMDVLTTIGGRLHGVEVKTFVDNANSKVTMHPSSRQRKVAWAKKNKARVHTVVVDARNRHSPRQYSGHDLYYARGSGSFRLSSMTPVRDTAHLLELMTAR